MIFRCFRLTLLLVVSCHVLLSAQKHENTIWGEQHKGSITLIERSAPIVVGNYVYIWSHESYESDEETLSLRPSRLEKFDARTLEKIGEIDWNGKFEGRRGGIAEVFEWGGRLYVHYVSSKKYKGSRHHLRAVDPKTLALEAPVPIFNQIDSEKGYEAFKFYTSPNRKYIAVVAYKEGFAGGAIGQFKSARMKVYKQDFTPLWERELEVNENRKDQPTKAIVLDDTGSLFFIRLYPLRGEEKPGKGPWMTWEVNSFNGASNRIETYPIRRQSMCRLHVQISKAGRLELTASRGEDVDCLTTSQIQTKIIDPSTLQLEVDQTYKIELPKGRKFASLSSVHVQPDGTRRIYQLKNLSSAVFYGVEDSEEVTWVKAVKEEGGALIVKKASDRVYEMDKLFMVGPSAREVPKAVVHNKNLIVFYNTKMAGKTGKKESFLFAMTIDESGQSSKQRIVSNSQFKGRVDLSKIFHDEDSKRIYFLTHNDMRYFSLGMMQLE